MRVWVDRFPLSIKSHKASLKSEPLILTINAT